MDVKILKFLVELSKGCVDVIDLNAFYAKFPASPSTSKELYRLKNVGFISILEADDSINCIGVNQKALDYFK